MRGKWRPWVAAFGLFAGTSAWAYRPYDSTDADVASERETEIELGLRAADDGAGHEQAIDAVLNIGIGQGREIVVEGQWLHSSVEDVGVFLKQVHRHGSLQDESGLSVASECGALIPTSADESGPGGECALILSHATAWVALHLNTGVTYRTDHRWSNSIALILEAPDEWRIRPGMEVLRESDESTLLLGVAGKLGEALQIDFGYRRTIDPSSYPSEWRVGITWRRER